MTDTEPPWQGRAFPLSALLDGEIVVAAVKLPTAPGATTPHQWLTVTESTPGTFLLHHVHLDGGAYVVVRTAGSTKDYQWAVSLMFSKYATYYPYREDSQHV